MIVEREREIRAFLPEEYWTVQPILKPSPKPPVTTPILKFALILKNHLGQSLPPG